MKSQHMTPKQSAVRLSAFTPKLDLLDKTTNLFVSKVMCGQRQLRIHFALFSSFHYIPK